MARDTGRTIAVIGATGLTGGAVARRLLADGWIVRGITRDAKHKKARALRALGAEVMQADANDPVALGRAFEGATGVYCVQNHHLSGYVGEVEQGKNVADAAGRAGVSHVVYGAAGIGAPGTGIGSWETKLEVAAHMRARELPLTVLWPTAFMELMTERKFFPPASVWHVMPELMGADRAIGWLAVDDLAVVASEAFADPQTFIGRDLTLLGDVRSIDGCRKLWTEITGRRPTSIPMPVALFERFVGTDETTMWRWLRGNDVDWDPAPTRAIHPDVLTVDRWIARKARRRGAAKAAAR